ncbi:YktB family protein [Desmospora activa]|uniref:Uncharacterized protein YktB (UPF0637 family) n=1 Tax=Desmospora activa DSM 45169 TaxID=1121389 RepID=A0A2T4ZBL7_9BACL|nr:DUF1054 domain-containing protein [Desmospora activa]PTM59283.1 uncharacterized protein YktB (UPF0637 family) [Desmospora activa DSM 45169]
MAFHGFTQSDFNVFSIPGLEPRMEALKERIRPNLEALGEEMAPFLSDLTGETMYVHVAKHARRSVHPPAETWVAWSSQKRGYKSLPHFQVGLREQECFAMFALIYEYPRKPEFARDLLEQLDEVLPTLPRHFVISQDHTRPETDSLQELGQEGLQRVLERLQRVKKAEFLCGSLHQHNESLLHKPDVLKKVGNHLFPSCSTVSTGAAVSGCSRLRL